MNRDKYFFEYIWLDGYQTPNIRSKTKVLTTNYRNEEVGKLPEWSFDGSSTKQAGDVKIYGFEGTDCILKPVFMLDDPFRPNYGKLVLCEVFEPDGKTPHKSNTRHKLKETITKFNLNGISFNDSPWFGWEQEYVLTQKLTPFSNTTEIPIGINPNSKEGPRPQGEYYCGVGSDNVVGRQIAEEHLRICTGVGLDICGINAEVLIGQWEYQIGVVDALNGSDQMWISRYILNRIGEINGVKISLEPKILPGDWNGSGCHVNFSTKLTRLDGGIGEIMTIIEKLKDRHNEHIIVYGENNHRRLTGLHETSDIKSFSFGFSDRGSSVRIPVQTFNDGKGYFEDRRPASNCDPYLVSKIMLETTMVSSKITDSEQILN